MKNDHPQNSQPRPAKSVEVGLAEIIYALDKLKPGSVRANEIILEALGFEWKDRAARIPESGRSESLRRQKTSTGENRSALNLEDLWKGKITAGTEELLPVRRSEPAAVEEDGDIEWEVIMELPETSVSDHLGLPAYKTLFKENWFIGIMSVLLGVSERTNSLDLKLIEKLFANASAVERLPYLSRQTLNYGVQLLIDISESMQPFRRDGDELIKRLGRLMNPGCVSVHKFEFAFWPEPEMLWWAGGPDSLQDRKPVLLVSDFGAGKYGSPFNIRDYESLMLLIRQAESKNCPLAALVPADEKNFPADLKNFIPMSFVWDDYISPQWINRLKRR